jgi:hypothetical protein
LPIWEGTTNILSLDVLRAITKTEGGVILAFRDAVMEKVSHARQQWGRDLRSVTCDILEKKLQETLVFLKQAAKERPEFLELSARDLAYSLARLYAGEKILGNERF